MTNICDDIAGLCRSVGIEVHGPMVYGPLDSIAIIVDLLMFGDQQECSEAVKLYPLARAIAEERYEQAKEN